MTQAAAAPQGATDAPPGRPRRSIAQVFEVDTRLLGMIGALAVIWLFFDNVSGGNFITPRNLWNLSVQSSSIAIMASAMVLIIVSRNIDLSVGSMLGFIGYVMAMAQTVWIPTTLGFGFGHPATWLLTIGLGLVVGAIIGGINGVLVAYTRVPSFIVTLGGLLVWRGLIFRFAQGQTVAPLDTSFRLLGGGPEGSLGEILSWVVGGLACAGVLYSLFAARRKRQRYGFPTRGKIAEVLIAGMACVAILAAVWVANNYFWPTNLAADYAERNNIPIPPGGLLIPTGIANPVLITIGVGIVVTYLATRRRFGRYVYAIGGNPDAAELGGINVRRTVTGTFVLMGMMAAIAGAVQTARLNAAVTNLGVQNELDVISAAVIGGTSFSGGIGTIPGAILGAVVMQSLRSGMLLLNVDSPSQDVVVGMVLVAAVGIDAFLRRRAG